MRFVLTVFMKGRQNPVTVMVGELMKIRWHSMVSVWSKKYLNIENRIVWKRQTILVNSKKNDSEDRT